MFKFVKKKTIDGLRRDLDHISALQKHLESENTQYQHEIKDLIDKLKEVEKANRELERQLDVFSDESSVYLKISDDLQTVVPVVKVKEELKDKMLQLGYLNDATTQETLPFAMQLVLMNIAYEALDQIIAAFAENVKEDD